MKIFVLPPEYAGDDFLEIKGDDFHYLCHVRRLKKGNSIPARDAEGNEYHVTLEEAGRKSCLMRVQKKGPDASRAGQAEGEASLSLYQCLLKGTKFDTIVRQAVELGVLRLVPVQSRYTAAKTGGEKNRYQRWQRIAREAVQQSGASRVPEISSPLGIAEIPRDFGVCGDERLGIFFHQNPLEINSLHGYLSSCPKEIALVIGPEGGLADDELALLREAGFVPAYLGHRVLRSETAPVFAAAAVRIILLERERWNLAHGN